MPMNPRLLPVLFTLAAVSCAFPIAREGTLTTAPTTILPPPTSRPTLIEPTPGPQPTATQPDPRGTIVFTCQLSGDSRFNQICLLRPDGSGFRQLTHAARRDHFYPSLSPSGDSVLFSANLDGAYDIYELSVAGGDPLQRTFHDGAYAPAVSPDGDLLAYTVIDGGDPAIWLAARDGGRPRWVLGRSWDATWSPDGAWILHASDRTGEIQLWKARPDGSDLQQVTELPELRGRSDWSPDGRWLATYAGPTWAREIYLFNDKGEDLRKLTDGGNNLAPSFSPEGAWITYTSYRDNYKQDDGCEIYIQSINTRERRRLTDNAYCDWQPRWGP